LDLLSGRYSCIIRFTTNNRKERAPDEGPLLRLLLPEAPPAMSYEPRHIILLWYQGSTSSVPVLSVLSGERSMRKWKTVPYSQSTNVRLRSKQIWYKDMKSNNHQRPPTAYGPRLWHYCLIIAFKIDDELQLRKSYKERGQNEGALYPQATIVRWSRHSAISYSSITYVSRIGPTIVLGWTTTKDDMFMAFLQHIFKTIQPNSTLYIMYGTLISTQER